MGLKKNIPSILITIAAIFSILSFISYSMKPKKIANVKPLNTWILYYATFGNPSIDKKFIGWRYKKNKYWDDWYEPPVSAPLGLFPQRGLYSTHDKLIIEDQFKEMSEAGINGVIVQWIGFNKTTDNNNEDVDFVPNTIKLMLESSERYNIKIGVLLQSYERRTNTSIYNSLEYILTNLSSHPQYLKYEGRPVIFIYDPHDVEDLFWSILKTRENYNPFYIGTFSNSYQVGEAVETAIDGLYTFFSANFSESSRFSNWKRFSNELKDRDLVFIPGVCPGADESRLDIGWGSKAQKCSRNNGEEYKKMWQAAIKTAHDSNIIVINSYNGFIDGTNIEPSIELYGRESTAESWSSKKDPQLYLQITKQMIQKWNETKFQKSEWED